MSEPVLPQPPTSQPAAPPPPPGSGSGMAWYIVALVVGVLLTMLGGSVLAGGIAAAVVAARQNAGDGYFSTRTAELSSSSYALTSPRIGGFTANDAPSVPFDVARVRILAESTTGDDVFIGLAPRQAVDDYLRGVAHTEVTRIDSEPFRVLYRELGGTETPEEPGDQTFWTQSVSGAGEQELSWSVQPGDWSVVIMNADASRGVSVDVQAGIRSSLLAPIAASLVITGLVMLLIGLPLIVLGAVGIGRRIGGTPPRQGMSAASAGQPPVGGMAAAGVMPAAPDEDRPYPAQLTGYLGPLSRWMWLVKWLLAIPHYILLFGLWIAFVVTTVIAGFAILFSGRYPRTLFNFNVGVLRWNWRVGFYAYSALATDRYPPFTLRQTDYPADFVVEYPERLSNGLVLVKWWLLAIPHYLVLSAVLGANGWWWGWGWRGSGQWDADGARVVGAGISLLTALVLIAAVILLFTGRYRVRLFEFIMGMNRWIYRVAAYAALMRDEYPPFRLDQGGMEPQRVGTLPAEAAGPSARATGQGM
ncbi:DUF4389 domain-containing protein [Salinibacterium sp. ZJ454]|uniref:DUF4389 domain-containing protein n=1 Tax=Salinibacterium sp. ZJ454 TaxID=2708339 RepID=UPI001FBAC17F|nr:DUF4389 domain-containing protein [Salinibacterium sp. ZJ454]